MGFIKKLDPISPSAGKWLLDNIIRKQKDARIYIAKHHRDMETVQEYCRQNNNSPSSA